MLYIYISYVSTHVFSHCIADIYNITTMFEDIICQLRHIDVISSQEKNRIDEIRRIAAEVTVSKPWFFLHLFYIPLKPGT